MDKLPYQCVNTASGTHRMNDVGCCKFCGLSCIEIRSRWNALASHFKRAQTKLKSDGVFTEEVDFAFEQFISDQWRVAEQDWKCQFCVEPIPTGAPYVRTQMAYEDGLLTSHTCEGCAYFEEIMSRK